MSPPVANRLHLWILYLDVFGLYKWPCQKKQAGDAEGIRLSGVEARKRGCLGCAAHGQSVVGQSMANQREVSVSRNWFSTKKAILIAKKRWQLTGCLWHWQSQMIPHVSVDRI